MESKCYGTNKTAEKKTKRAKKHESGEKKCEIKKTKKGSKATTATIENGVQ